MAKTKKAAAKVTAAKVATASKDYTHPGAEHPSIVDGKHVAWPEDAECRAAELGGDCRCKTCELARV